MKADERALRYYRTFRDAGADVREVLIKGNEVRLVLSSGEELDDFDAVDMSREKRAS